MLQTHYQKDTPTLGIGYYTVPEAARLLKIRPLNIRRWLGGYSYTHGDKTIDMPPSGRLSYPHMIITSNWGFEI
ncbi:hypothetical protein ACNJX9_03035 [Bradyrhizobium sp. DASA03076]|uniref:hypothetical protein n=1 Tax=Bradyrhizobium sp. BLXBL-03 TaxID=3395916 RepID=UPI003F6E6F40